MQVQAHISGGKTWTTWAVAVACAVAALLVRLSLAPWLGDRMPFSLFAPAAMIAAWFGGLWPGLLVIAAGLVLGDWFFLPPVHAFGPHGASEWSILLIFLFTSLVGVGICEALHRSRRRLHALADDLREHTRTLEQELVQRRQTEQALREMEKLSRRVIDANVIGILLADMEGNIIDANDAFLDLLGYVRSDVETGRLNFLELTPAEFRHLDQQAIEQLRIRGRHEPFEKELLRSDRTRVPVLVGTAFMPGERQIGITYVVNLTEQKRAQQVLRDSEQRYRFLAESIPQIVFTARPDGVTNYNNRQLFDYFGVTPDEAQSLGWIYFRHPEDREEASRRWRHSIETGEPYEGTYRLLRGSDRTYRWHLARAVPMRDSSGKIVMWFGTCTDIDDQKRAQDALRASEEEFRAVFELAGSGKALVDPGSGRFVRVNRKLCEMTGYSAEELLQRTFSDITHPDDLRWSGEEAQRLLRGETSLYSAEKRYVRKDGQTIWVHVTATLIRDAEGKPLRAAGLIEDITERKHAEQAVRDSEARFRAIFNQAAVGIGVTELDGRFVQVNQKVCDITGYTAEELCTRTFWDITHPDDRKHNRELNEKLLAGEISEFCLEKRYLRRDGSVVWVNVTVCLLRDAEGRPLRNIGVIEDISARKRVEEQLAAANQAKDQFLATLSHELRTPLTPVVLALDSLRADPSLPDAVRDDLDMIQRNVGLEAKLIDDLLDLTRVTRGKLELRRELVDVHAAVNHAVRSCCGADAQQKRLTVKVDLKAAEHHVRADRSRLEQVFFNVLRNAVKFTSEGGCICILSRNDQAGQVTIEISDDGIGIEAHILPRIFNAFEQGDRDVTRQFGGLGLGLAVCKAIVELHGGTIYARSLGTNRGATFVVELPLAESVENEQGLGLPLSGARLVDDGNAPVRILLVEDHQPTSSIMLRLLGGLKYDVKSAPDVATARRLANENEFDLVVSDLGLPDGSGLDLMRELSRDFGLRGIALSGYGMEEDFAQSKAAGFVEHLVKPVSFNTLETAMIRALTENTVHRCAEGTQR